jgi:tetratricopeptide (TPR) repeat protein
MKEELGESEGKSIELLNVGSAYLKKSMGNKALVYYFRALRSIEDTSERTERGRTMGNIGMCYLTIAKDYKIITPDSLVMATKQANLAKAITYLNDALILSREVGELNDVSLTLRDLSEALEEYGDYRGALAKYREHVVLEDSIFSEESIAKITRLESKRALEIKDKDIQIAKLRTWIFGGCIMLLLIVIFFIVFRFIKQTRSTKLLALERVKNLRRINAQNKILERIVHIQSHELRGAVTTIMGLSQIFNYDDPSDPHNLQLMSDVSVVAQKMDVVITEVINEENKLMKSNDEDNGK